MRDTCGHIIYLGIGSNLGDRSRHLSAAVTEIERRVGRIIAVSEVMETEPVGFESDHPFLNQVISVASNLCVRDLLLSTQEIERQLGREHKSINGGYSDRTCDIDILLYDDLCVCEPDLIIPHPRMLERDFVMRPLCEIAPDLVIPGMTQTVKDLAWDG